MCLNFKPSIYATIMPVHKKDGSEHIRQQAPICGA